MTLRQTILAAAAALCVSSVSASNIEPRLNVQMLESKIDTMLIEQFELDFALAPAKNHQQLYDLSGANSPLSLLSESAKQRFIESVKFTDNGVASFYLSDLEAELTYSQVYRVLSLIGAQSLITKVTGARIESRLDAMLAKKGQVQSMSPIGEKGYYCASKGTCRQEDGAICTKSC